MTENTTTSTAMPDIGIDSQHSAEDIAEATRIAKAIVKMAKARALAYFTSKYGREPIPMPARIGGGRQHAIAVQADRDAREYNDILTRYVMTASREWEASISAGKNTKTRLQRVQYEMNLA